jgi:hypothetical protein
MFTVYLIKVFGVGTLTFVLALIKCYGVAINVAGLPNVRETLLQKFSYLATNRPKLIGPNLTQLKRNFLGPFMYREEKNREECFGQQIINIQGGTWHV